MRNRYTDAASRLWIQNPRVEVVDRYGDRYLIDLNEVSTDSREVSYPEIQVQPSLTVERSVQQIMDILEEISRAMLVSMSGGPEQYLLVYHY